MIRRTDNQPLNEDQLKKYAPSIFAEEPHCSVSEQYTFIPTIQILRHLMNEGWAPMAVAQTRVNDTSKRGYQKHMIRLTMPHLSSMNIADSRVEIVLINSHDRSSTFQLYAGLFRFVCANGLIICDHDMGRISTRHVGGKASDILDASYRVIDDIPVLAEKIETFRQTKLEWEEQHHFAEAAASLRYDPTGGTSIDPTKLLIARRDEDRAEGQFFAEPDLWTTLNVVQENLIRGGIRTRAKTMTRRVNSITTDLSLNQKLWKLAADVFSGKNNCLQLS